MGIEIERKFLVANDDWKQEQIIAIKQIKQGYLFNEGGSVLRVRLSNAQAFLTYKTKRTGNSCGEYEYEIPYTDGQELYQKCADYYYVVEKTRYCVQVGTNMWEVDIFEGFYEGTQIAEIELQSEDQVIDIPSWIGQEVSDNPYYANVKMAERNFLNSCHDLSRRD